VAKLLCEDVARTLGSPVKREGPELVYRCPHPEKHTNGDAHPSLKINAKKDVFLCGPCGAKGKAWALAAFIAGVNPSDKQVVRAWLAEKGLLSKRGRKSETKTDGRGPVVATFVHEDADGHPVCRKLRHEPGANGKEKDYTWQSYENGEWKDGLGSPKIIPPLYRLPQIKDEPIIFLFESHTDVERAVSMRLPATTSGGADSWRPEYGDTLAGKDVCLTPDNNTAGARYAAIVCQSLHGRATSLRVVSIAPHPDFRRWADAGGTLERFLDMWEAAPEWQPPSGAEILENVLAFLTRYVCMTPQQARVVALWVAHSHAFDAADATPYLSVNSAEKQSGKTRLLECLRLLVFCPWFTGRVTAAVLTRKIDSEHPTLLLDESDAAFRAEKEYSEALRGILNTGYRRGGAASCCVGQGAAISYKDFSTFCPKAIAGIGRLPDTVQDRAVPIKLKRATRGTVARFREREAQREASEIAARLAAWATANLGALREARPGIPSQLSDRQADCCEPLLAIADLAGGEWPESARTALVTLCGQAQAEDDSIGARLLQDIRVIFGDKEVDELSSGELCENLAKIETSPWGEWHGKPITPARLARLLKGFEVSPDRIGGKASQSRGYTVRQFEDAFRRYLPSETVNPSTDRINTAEK